ncbi:MAG: bifunctional phosphoribosyl-AMP cyclohydrolase/phosphoribosyl-ATP diphosphatase HisIE [Prevotellaceae bacterium]|nr:bifunctional phosphoribosyl-AMP cyclohydrolase/phosphoribosyl-ATP diphosphatase HisIE [Prevotellaceae bacterium]
MTIDFLKGGGLVPAIVQDANTLRVLMLGYMNEEAYQKTLETKRVTFWSRTRKTLWTKGETSGNYLNLVDIKVDCDKDTLLVKVLPEGPVCHTGADTCWGEENKCNVRANERRGACSLSREQPNLAKGNPLLFLSELSDFIETRHREMPEDSYTTSLFKEGLNRMAQKVGEESLELVIEATNGTDERLIYEGSDMLYHLIVLLTSKGLRIEDMAAELEQRHKPGWKKH